MQSLESIRRKFGPQNPLAPPDRRYRLAKAYVRRRLQRSCRDDRWTQGLRSFLLNRELLRSGVKLQQPLPENSELAIAFDIWRDKAPELRPLIEAYLMTELDDESIATKLRIPTLSVQWYRYGFFDIARLLPAPHRVLYQVIKVADESGRPSLDNHKVWKLVGYVLKSKALDQLLGAIQSDSNPAGGAATWLTSQAEAIAKLQQLLAVGALDAGDPKQLAAILKLAPPAHAIRKGQENEPSTIIERHIQAMLDDLPWSVGQDGEKMFEGTEIGKHDESAYELRDDELLRLGAGEDVPGLKELKDLKIPPPTKKKSIFDPAKSMPNQENVKPPK